MPVLFSNLSRLVSALCFACFLAASAQEAARIVVPPMVSNGMVMQRGRVFPLRGTTGQAFASVAVEWRGEQYAAQTDADGRFEVCLNAGAAGGPFELRIKAGNLAHRIDSVYVGEVWLASGQSNMELTVSETATAAADLKDAARHPLIHIYNQRARFQPFAVEWSEEELEEVNRLRYLRPTRWQQSSAAAIKEFSAIGYHFARVLADSLHCPVGIICNAVGGATCEAWIDSLTLQTNFKEILDDFPDNSLIMEWARKRVAKNCAKAVSERQLHPYMPAYLYNCGLRPWKDYALRGVLWYQGESNAQDIATHERLFPLLLQSWRTALETGGEDLPFLFVQLSSISTRPTWPAFRDSQRKLAEANTNVWMSVCSDLGDSLNVHPTHKREVGERLAASALHRVYGFHDVVPSGPMVRAACLQKDAVAVSFDYGCGLHPASGKKIIGFELAGNDGKFYPASAEAHPDGVVLRSPQVPAPTAVRYGWQPFTRANLVNAAGLPASTFACEVK